MLALLQVLQAGRVVSQAQSHMPTLIRFIKQAIPTLHHSASLHMVLQTHAVELAAQKERSSASVTPAVSRIVFHRTAA